MNKITRASESLILAQPNSDEVRCPATTQQEVKNEVKASHHSFDENLVLLQ